MSTQEAGREVWSGRSSGSTQGEVSISEGTAGTVTVLRGSTEVEWEEHNCEVQGNRSGKDFIPCVWKLQKAIGAKRDKGSDSLICTFSPCGCSAEYGVRQGQSRSRRP